MLIVNPQGEWTIYFNQPEGSSRFNEPLLVSLYSFRTSQSLEATFIPDPQRSAPEAARINLFENDYYAPSSGGILITDACNRGILETIASMQARGTLRTIFKPAPPPSFRWSTLRLRELPLPDAAEKYC